MRSFTQPTPPPGQRQGPRQGLSLSPQVHQAIGGYIWLNICILLLGKLVNLMDPVRRRRFLWWALVVQIALAIVILGLSTAMVGSSYGYMNGTDDLDRRWVQQESLRQMCLFFVAPSVLFGILGLVVNRYFWRSTTKALAEDGSSARTEAER